MRPCMECERVLADHRDPRCPPLDGGDQVLCLTCFEDAKSDRVEQLQDEIAALEIET